MNSECPWKLNVNILIDHINEISDFLARYSWIYQVKNTDILLCDVVENIPNEWKETLLKLDWDQLNKIPFGFMQDDWPASLTEFITKCNEFTKFRFPTQTFSQVCKQNFIPPNDSYKNVPLKKQEEVKTMSSLVAEICRTFGCRIVLDIGSGLGYLDQVLHQNFGLTCIGLDCKTKHTEKAILRIKENPCSSFMTHHTICIENTEKCLQILRSMLKNVHSTQFKCQCMSAFKNEGAYDDMKVVMVGLHCCGGLFADMMKLFCQMPEIKAFVCVGCCYHLMKAPDVPLSKRAGDVSFVCIPGLRLASECTRTRWSQQTHQKEKHLTYRALLQYYLKKESIEWQKPKRRIRETCMNSFEEYCLSMFQDAHQEKKQQRIKDLLRLCDQKKHLFPSIRILMVLQMLLQPVWECWVVADRAAFLQESSLHVEVLSLWDDSASPRNLAVVATKG